MPANLLMASRMHKALHCTTAPLPRAARPRSRARACIPSGRCGVRCYREHGWPMRLDEACCPEGAPAAGAPRRSYWNHRFSSPTLLCVCSHVLPRPHRSKGRMASLCISVCRRLVCHNCPSAGRFAPAGPAQGEPPVPHHHASAEHPLKGEKAELSLPLSSLFHSLK